MIYGSGGTMTENKIKTVQRFPNCNCSEDSIQEQGTYRDVKLL
jgi:hypothetical protein